MTSNFQPPEEIFDDVEGHTVSDPIEVEETDDVAGHLHRPPRTYPVAEDDDVEGHDFRPGHDDRSDVQVPTDIER